MENLTQTNDLYFSDIAVEGTEASFNGTASEDSISTAISDKIMKGVYITISSLGIMGNLLVLVVLLGLTTMRKRITPLFIINQSIVDALTALFLLLTTLLPSDGRVYRSVADDVYCRFWVARLPLWLCIHSSTYNLVALTLERYASVVYPIVHKSSFTYSRALLTLALVWCVGATYSFGGMIPISFMRDGVCILYSFGSITAMKLYGIISFFINYFIPICILIYCYSRIGYALNKKVAPQVTNEAAMAGEKNRTSTTKIRAKKNVIKTMIIVSLAFIACSSWNQWFFVLFNVGVIQPSALNSNFYHFSVVAMFANCCVNPFIYAAKYEEFKKGLQRLFTKKRDGTRQSSVTDQSITA